MSTFAQTSDGDLAISGGRLTIERDPAKVAAITLRNKFLRGRGSWFLNTLEGIPYFSKVFRKGTTLPVIRQIFEAVILSVPEVVQVEELNVALRSDRTLLADFRARCEDGRVLVGGLGDQFVIEVE